MDSPPVPLNAVKSPPWIMKDLMTRWKIDPGPRLSAQYTPFEAILRTFVAQRLARLPNTFLASRERAKVLGCLGNDYLPC